MIRKIINKFGNDVNKINLPKQNNIPNEKILTGIHSHHSWDSRKTMPDEDFLPPKKLVRFLKKYKAVNAVSNKLTRIFKKAGLDTVQCTLNGVDTELFKPLKPMH